MRRTLAGLLLATAPAIVACDEPVAPIPVEERIIARVDGVEIKRGDYDSYLRFGIELPGTGHADEAPDASGASGLNDQVQSRLLDRILLEKAVAAAAVAAGEVVSEADLDAFATSAGIGSLASLAEAMPLTQRQFLLAYMRDSLLAKHYLENRLLDDLLLDEATTRAFYQEHIDLYTLPPRFRLRQIHVSTLRDSRQLARAAGRSRDRFLAYAEELSQTSEEEQGKDLGLWPLARLPESFAKAVEGLDSGDVSATFQDSDGGYDMLLVEERLEGRVQPYDEVADAVRTRLEHQLRSSRTRAYLERLQQASKVDIIDENLGFSYQPPAPPAAVETAEDEAPSASGGAS